MKITKLIFISLCCICCSVAAQAQETPGKIRLGVKGGIHASNLYYSDLDQYSPKGITTFAGGLFAEFDLGAARQFSLRPELLFLTRGANLTDQLFNYELEAKYMDIRLPLVFNFTHPGTISPYVYIAPVLGIATGGNIRYREKDDDGIRVTLDANNANLAKINLAAAAGAGVRIPIKVAYETDIHVALDANYQFGITDTYGSKEKNGEAIAVNTPVYNLTGTRKHRGLEVTASLSVPLSIFKKREKPKRPVQPATVFRPIMEESLPVEKEEEKPCYTVEEILALVDEGKPAAGKTICAIDVINFEFGKSNISETSSGYLDKIVMLMKNSDIRIEIKGHTDNVGSEAFNLELSRQRAKAVYDHLTRKGVDPERLSYSYYGMGKPLTSNQTEEGRLVNRRVEFEINK